MAEFSCNNTMHSTMQQTPLFANHGYIHVNHMDTFIEISNWIDVVYFGRLCSFVQMS